MKTKEELIEAVITFLTGGKEHNSKEAYTAFRDLLDDVRVDRLRCSLPMEQQDQFFTVLDNKLYDIWYSDDVIEQGRERYKVDLTEQQAREILAMIDREGNAEIGVNWDVIGVCISELIREMEKAGTPLKKYESGFVVLMGLVSGSEEIAFWHEYEDGDNGHTRTPAIYETEEEAWAEIDDCINSIDEAIERGDMDEDSRDTRDEYRVVPANEADKYL